MFNAKLIKYALATVIAAAGVFSFSAYADGFAVEEPADSTAAAAPEETTAPTPFNAPRYFNPVPPRHDNPTDSPGAWEVYPSPTTRDLYCVDFVDANNGWAGGRSVALRYRNGTWSEIPGHSGHVFDDIDMLSLNDGWAVGWDGNKEKPAIWRWNGSDWKEFQLVTGAIKGVFMLDPNHGWISGNGYFLRYNGANWVWGGSAPRYMYGIYMFSGTSGWSVGSRGTIMHRVGSSWMQVPGNSDWTLARVWMLSGTEGWACGYKRSIERGMLLKCAGVIWTEYRIYDNVRSIAEINIYQYNFGWCVGWTKTSPPYGAFIAYFDGADWNPVIAPTNKALMGIEILDRDEAWIVGEAGIILKYKPNVGVTPSSVGKIKARYR